MLGGCRLDPKSPDFIASPEVMLGQFYAELMTLVPGWKRRLMEQPEALPELEREVHRQFSRGADLVVVGLISWVMQQAAFASVMERVKRESLTPLTSGRWREVKVRLLGGLAMWVTSLYCQARGRPAGLADDSEDSEDRVGGLNLGLAALGFAKGCSGELESRVARLVALGPSIEFARSQLARDGVVLDEKAVRRITLQCGESLLSLRQHELDQFRQGTLPAGTELVGKRVSVQIDGGRSRIRGDLTHRPKTSEILDELGLPTQDQAGRSRVIGQRTFEAPWREPKLVTIFVHDDQGRMVKTTRAAIEGTFAGPDALAEFIAMRLHALGAARATSITFVSDGAPWIWDRISVIKRLAKLEGVVTHEVLDCCHATHHISGALKALGLTDAARLPLYREHRTLLRNGQWRRVVSELTDLASDAPPEHAVWTEIAYLEKHGTAGRLSYPHFKGLGLPLGSGAIESSIRRVINQRLKSNSTFWKEASAEAMLQLRCQLLTDRWDDRLTASRHLRSRAVSKARKWTHGPISKAEATCEANSESTA